MSLTKGSVGRTIVWVLLFDCLKGVEGLLSKMEEAAFEAVFNLDLRIGRLWVMKRVAEDTVVASPVWRPVSVITV